MSFDPTGAPRWGLSGGSSSTDPMYALSVAADGVAHLSGITGGPFILGADTVDPGATRGSVVARVDPDLNTGAFEDADVPIDLAAVPSVFTTSFRLNANPERNWRSASVEVLDAAGRVV